MTIKVTHPSGATVDFPDGTDEATIARAMKQLNPPPETSATGAFLTGVGQGAGLGFGDELEAAARAGYQALTGGDKTFSQAYEQTLPEVRSRMEKSAEEHPIAYYGGELGGAVALPMGAARAGLSLTARAAARRAVPGMASNLPAMIGAGAAEGAIQGGLTGYGKGEGGIQPRLEGAAGGAALGGLVGGSAPALVGAAGHAYDTLASNVRAVTNPTREATNRVARALIEDDTAATVARMAGGNPLRPNMPWVNAARNDPANPAFGLTNDLRLMDEGGQTTRAMARSAANQSPEAREIIEGALMPRAENQTGRIYQFLDNLTGNRLNNATQSAEDLRTAARQANRTNYDAVMTAGDRPLWSRNLEAMTGSDMVRNAMQRAASKEGDRAIAEGYGAMNPGVEFIQGGGLRFTRGGQVTYPNLRFWDQVKREIDDTAQAARRVGRNAEASTAESLARRMRGELDSMVPEYQTARGVAAQHFDAADALEAGQRFATGRWNLHEAERAINQMAPAERAAFENGFVSGYLDKISRVGDNRNILNTLMNSPHDRAVFATALGQQRANELEAMLHLEQIMQVSKNAMGNSTTARQLKELGMTGLALTGGGIAGGGDITNPTTWITAGLIKWAPGRAAGVINDRMAVRIAQILTEPANTQGVRAVYAQMSRPNNLAHLRRISNALTASGAAAGAEVSAQRAAP